MDFDPRMNAPTGVGAGAPSANSSSLGEVLNAFTQGAQARNQLGSPARLPLANAAAGRQQQQLAPDLVNAAYGRGEVGTQSARASKADSDLSTIFGAEDAASLRAGFRADPQQPAVGLASPATVRANQQLFFGKDGKPVSVAQLYQALAAPSQGEIGALDPLQLLRAATLLSVNPATADVAKVLMRGALEQIKEVQPTWQVVSEPQRGQRIAPTPNAAGSAAPMADGATAIHPQTGERIIFKDGRWRAMP
jgi:hypothetical protein